MSPGTRPVLRRLVQVVFAIAVAVVAFFPAPTRAAAPCWQSVIDEWVSGRLAQNHAPSCYRQAIAHAPTDLKLYSTFQDDVLRAMQSRVLGRAAGPVRRLSSASVAPASSSSDSWRPGYVTVAAAALVLVAGTWTATAVVVSRRRR